MPSIVCSCPFLPLGLSKIWCHLVLQEGGENLKSRNLKSKPINLCRFELFPSLLAAYHLRNIAYWTPDWSFAINDASLEVSPCCFSWETGNINVCVNSNTLPPWSKGHFGEIYWKTLGWYYQVEKKSCLVFFHFNTLANSRIESQPCLVKLRLRFQRSKLESSGTSTTSDHGESARKIPRKSGGLAAPEQLHPKAFPIRQRFHQTKDLYIDHFQTERCNLNTPKTFRQKSDIVPSLGMPTAVTRKCFACIATQFCNGLNHPIHQACTGDKSFHHNSTQSTSKSWIEASQQWKHRSGDYIVH